MFRIEPGNQKVALVAVACCPFVLVRDMVNDGAAKFQNRHSTRRFKGDDSKLSGPDAEHGVVIRQQAV
jgi:hypothetical protein